MAKAAHIPSTDSPPDSTTEDDDPQSPSQPGSSKKSKSSRAPLSEQQKSTNHKDAENKRRTAIREQFTELSKLVPGAEGHERSEYLMLQMTIEHIKTQTEEARRLEDEIVKLGGTVADGERIGDDEWGGSKWDPKNVREYDAAKARKSANENRETNDSANASTAKLDGVSDSR